MTITSEEKLGFDSNIIIYALDRDSKYHKRTKSVLKNLRRNGRPLFIAHQNILETERALIKVFGFDKKMVLNDIDTFIDVFDLRLISPLPTTINRYHNLLLKNKGLYMFDIYLAATYIDNGIRQMYTANEKDFKVIPGFKAINPYK